MLWFQGSPKTGSPPRVSEQPSLHGDEEAVDAATSQPIFLFTLFSSSKLTFQGTTNHILILFNAPTLEHCNIK